MVIKMENKILIKLYVISLNKEFDIFIPVNEVVWQIKKLLVSSLADITNISLLDASRYILINIDTGKIYNNNDIIFNTDIRNYTRILLVENL